MMAVAASVQLIGLAMIAAAMHAAPLPVKRFVGKRRKALPLAGWVLLVLSGWIVLAQGPLGPQLLCWFGLLTVCAGAVLLCFTMVASRSSRRAGKGREQRG